MIQPHALAASNPGAQAVAWLGDAFGSVQQHWGSVSIIVAVAAATYLVVMLFQRSNSDEDPSVTVQQSSATGSTSFLISGVYVTGLLLAVIAFATWPLPVEQPFVGAAMLGAAGYHYYLERREVMS